MSELLLFGIHSVSSLSWENVYSYTGDGDAGGASGYTFRQWIDTNIIGETGGSKIRVTYYAAASEALTISKSYIGMRSSGDNYDFDTTPTQITFNDGNSGFAISAGESILSDAVNFEIEASKDIVISYYVSGGSSNDGIRRNSSVGASNTQFFYKSGDDAATVDASGYTNGTAGILRVVLKLEVLK